MKRYFLFIFIIYIGLNTIYNSYTYFSSDKVSGEVIGFERYSKTRRTRNGGTTTEISDSPVVVFSYKNKDWETSRSKWGYINLLDIGDEVTILIDEKDQNNVSINTLFQFWFTLYDMFIVFLFCLIGTIILESLWPTREKTPKTWK